MDILHLPLLRYFNMDLLQSGVSLLDTGSELIARFVYVLRYFSFFYIVHFHRAYYILSPCDSITFGATAYSPSRSC